MNRLDRCMVGLLVVLLPLVSFSAERVRIANEGEIRDEWKLADGAKLAVPGYPSSLVDRGDTVCMAMGYSIKPDGTTSDFSILKSWSSAGEQEPKPGYWDAFAQASAGALSQWRFAPRPEVKRPKPTYTVATLTFQGREAMEAAALQGHCKIDDLAALVKSSGAASRRSDGANKADIERVTRQYRANSALIESR